MAALEHQTSRWRAAASPGGLIGLVLVILSLVVGITAYLGVTDRFGLPISDTVLWGVVALAGVAVAFFVFLFWGYVSIGYRLDAETLQINWGIWSRRIPLQEIESVAPAEEVLGPGSSGWKPLWPGYYVGRGKTESGEVEVVATLPRRRQVLISVSDGRRYAISPERPLLFMEELARWHRAASRAAPEAVPVPQAATEQQAQQFVDAGWTSEYSTHELEQYSSEATASGSDMTAPDHPHPEEAPTRTRVYRSPPSSTSPMLRPILLRDSVALSLIGIGVLSTVAMVTFILVQYDDIPQSLTLHWNAEGLPGRVGEPREIWILPTIAGLVLFANLGLAWSIALFDRFAARLMLGATVIAHVVTWVALLMLIG